MTPAARADEESGPLSILLSCPKCGGPFAADDEVVSVTCAHCGSLLLLQAPEREEIYLADGQVAGGDDLLEVVILYRVQSQRAEIAGRYRDSEGNPPPEAFIAARLRDYEQRLRQVARVLEAHRFHAPYWHITGKIVQGILGRHRDGPKLVRLRAFAVEHTVAAYDPGSANLRDKGLRLSRARVRPLTVRDVQERGPFLPWVAVPERPYREIDRWRAQDLDRELEPVTKHALFLSARRVLVYRPYWLARVITDTGQEWVLVDGSFATIGGHPGELECRSLTALGATDPLHSGAASFRRVHVVASRCPDCGSEQVFDDNDVVSVCSNCHRGLALGPDGVRLVPYVHVRDEGSDYLPFWRYAFEVRTAGGSPARRLEQYAQALFGRQLPPGFAAEGAHLWVPAFRLLGTEPGDVAFKDLSEWAHAARLEALPEKIPLGAAATRWGVSLPEPEARGLAPFVLLGLHGKPSAARLNTLLFRKAVGAEAIALSDPTLVMVPFERSGEELRRDGVRFPLLLLRGGPELEAQRATVHRATAERLGA